MPLVETSPEADLEGYLEGLPGAYYAVIQWLFQEDTTLHENTSYMAVDLSDVMLEKTEELISVLEVFCEENGYTLLLDDYTGLQEAGYIAELYFEEGTLITFHDSYSNESRLVTSAEKWRSGLAAIGATFTVEKGGNHWKITELSERWIS